jgi:hypothetical protein
MYICIQVYIHTGIINYDQYIQPDFIIKLTIKSHKPIPYYKSIQPILFKNYTYSRFI